MPSSVRSWRRILFKQCFRRWDGSPFRSARFWTRSSPRRGPTLFLRVKTPPASVFNGARHSMRRSPGQARLPERSAPVHHGLSYPSDSAVPALSNTVSSHHLRPPVARFAIRVRALCGAQRTLVYIPTRCCLASISRCITPAASSPVFAWIVRPSRLTATSERPAPWSSFLVERIQDEVSSASAGDGFALSSQVTWRRLRKYAHPSNLSSSPLCGSATKWSTDQAQSIGLVCEARAIE